jgi:uncharacterized membrane protein YhhN
MRSLSLILFILSGLGEIISTLYPLQLLHVICKPLIMFTLGLYYFSSLKTNASRLVFASLLFSWIGDIVLLDEVYFIHGLASFLFVHIFYIFAYRQHQEEGHATALHGIQRVRLAFPLILASTGMLIILYPVLKTHVKLPIVLYTIILVAMVLQALFRFGKTNFRSFWLVFAGATLFMISDSIFAINKFLSPIPLGDFWIMITYIPAQFLIVEGLLAHAERAAFR